MTKARKQRTDERVETALKILEGKSDDAPPVTPSEPAKTKAKRGKQSALDKIEGQQQELIAKALLATDAALTKGISLLKTISASAAPQLIGSIARVAQSQADIAQLVNAERSGFKDPESIQARVSEALAKLPGL